jgi:eukaryotic-like serine/threonine-protein kinase
MSDQPDGTPADPPQTTPAQGPGTLPQPATAGEPPCRAGRYRIEGELARGGMGAVYRALDPELGRPLAVKVLLACHAGDAALEARFLEEARVTAQLQHPGVPPVHEVGRLADGRPFLAMRLVKGRTLAELLAARHSPSEDLPRFLALFGQVSQAVAYAHSKGVVHRDLKPGNVMVGAFGEVQLMDWGLAKVLGPPSEPSADSSTLFTTRAGDDLQTQAGSVLGTPAYMAPEQARGNVAAVDERCDVFGLGAILCVILTGAPPYRGDNVARQARQADLADAHARLDGCGADPALVGLCRRCLAAEPGARPRDGGEVAGAVATYQAGVQERLRRAELDRAAARARAAAERRARRLTAGLAVAAVLLVAGGGAVAWAWQRYEQARQGEARERRQRADAAVALALHDARRLRRQALGEPLGDAARFREARAAAQRAGELARTGGASDEVRREAEELGGELARQEKAAERDRELLGRLLEVRGPREGPRFKAGPKGLAVMLAEPSADEQFAAAFRGWGLDVDRVPVAEAAARLKGRPPAVVTEVIAALDEWADERRQRPPREGWQRLEALADALDAPGSRRRQLRVVLAGGRLSVERALGWLAAGLGRLPVPFDAGLGQQRLRLRRLAGRVDPAREPVLGLLTLARALREAGDDAQAERLLRDAVRARPQEVVLYQALGELLESGPAPRWQEAAECFAVVRALRPGLGQSLARALVKSGRVREGLAEYERLARERPDNPLLPFKQGNDLSALERFREAEAAYRKALRLRPDLAEAHNNLGSALVRQGDWAGAEAAYRRATRWKPKFHQAYFHLSAVLERRGRPGEAEAACRRAIALKPDYAKAHFSLGVVLGRQGRFAEAEAAFREAVRLQPDDPLAHFNLALFLCVQGKNKEAEAACRAAIRLQPDDAKAHYILGVALEKRGKHEEAEAACRRAIALKPDYAKAHSSLGGVIGRQGKFAEAEAACREAIRLKPDFPEAHHNLGNALYRQGRHREAEAAFREAVRLKPDDPLAHCNLGHALRQQGRFAEALQALRRGHALGGKVPGWPYPSALWVRQCQRLLELDGNLPAVLRGDAEPASARERVELAILCGQYRRLHAAAARLADEAFTADPRLADNLGAQHRYNAACSAALAAAGQGEDARLLPDKVALMLRLRALRWLRADLGAYAQLLQRGNPALKQVIGQRLAHWQHDPDLAPVREGAALAKLPADERELWRELWAEVSALRKRAGGGHE